MPTATATKPAAPPSAGNGVRPRGAGRPPLPAGAARNLILQVRLNPAERARTEGYAMRQGWPMSRVIRERGVPEGADPGGPYATSGGGGWLTPGRGNRHTPAAAGNGTAGRPPLPPSEKRDRPVAVRVTRRERERIETAARREGWSLGRTLREHGVPDGPDPDGPYATSGGHGNWWPQPHPHDDDAADPPGVPAAAHG